MSMMSDEKVHVISAAAQRRLDAAEAIQAKRQASERRDARVGILLEDGHSYLGIAAILGVTKNAVAGIVSRRFRSNERRQHVVRVRENGLTTRGEARRVSDASPPVPPAPVAVVQPIRPVLVTIVAAGAGACRWPMWSAEDSLDDKRLCGSACARGVYCAGHSRLAYREPTIRRAA